MKLKSMVLVLCFGLFTNAFAANVHSNPKATSEDQKSIASKVYPGNCEIEIVNRSYTDVRITGTFDDYTDMYPFWVYSYESPHYISLFYNWYCHSGMWLTVTAPNGVIYSGWTATQSTINIVPFLDKQAKAEMSSR